MTLPTIQQQVILCLCPEIYHWKLIPGYAAAFRRRGFEFFCIEDTLPFDVPLDEILKLSPSRPSWIFHFESGLPLLPQGLESSPIPTVCFHADTYAFTRQRIRWSYLFDHVAVFHPGYDGLFARAGHLGAFLLPHAVRREFFDGVDLLREFELGWVGQTSGSLYRRRGHWLPRLATQFCINDLSRQYSLEEVAEVYRRSRIVVNIGRDDFPQDANLRVFEVLASGALLLTSMPTELTLLGFQEGVHFAGYSNDEEIIPRVRFFLHNETERSRIASAARTKTLLEHTYDQRVEVLLNRLNQFADKKLAPARTWPRYRAHLMALDFFASHEVMDCALRQYSHLAGRNLHSTFEGAELLARGYARKILRSRKGRS